MTPTKVGLIPEARSAIRDLFESVAPGFRIALRASGMTEEEGERT
jgi:hypothetical protein